MKDVVSSDRDLGSSANQRALWITWERQRRSRALSAKFGADLAEIIVSKSRAVRYLSSATQTVKLLRARRPDILFVQSPSIVLALIAATLGRLWSGRIVVDAHNAGIYPLEGRSRVLNALCRQALRMADFVLVSNAELRVQLGLSNVLVLPDSLMDGSEVSADAAPAASEGPPAIRPFRVTYVASWAEDEPFRQVIEAADRLPSGVQIRITGRAPPAIAQSLSLPSNLSLLGFLEDSAYLDELRSTDVVLVLTRREACLTCGAYEAVSLGKPLILSSTRALRSYFGEAAVYTENRPENIADAVLAAKEGCAAMQDNSIAARHRLSSEWQEKFNEIKGILRSRSSSHSA
jgi:glycosyltransferase involved in cell wall biosynthesis